MINFGCDIALREVVTRGLALGSGNALDAVPPSFRIGRVVVCVLRLFYSSVSSLPRGSGRERHPRHSRTLPRTRGRDTPDSPRAAEQSVLL